LKHTAASLRDIPTGPDRVVGQSHQYLECSQWGQRGAYDSTSEIRDSARNGDQIRPTLSLLDSSQRMRDRQQEQRVEQAPDLAAALARWLKQLE